MAQAVRGNPLEPSFGGQTLYPIQMVFGLTWAFAFWPGNSQPLPSRSAFAKASITTG